MSDRVLQQAEMAIGAGDRLTARTLLSNLLGREPDNVRALHLMSVMDLKEGNIAAARERIAHILRVDPKHAAANQNLGVIAMQDGDFTTAIACFRRTLASQPGHSGALYNLGQMLRSSGQHDEAVREFRRLATHAPTFAAGWEALAETQLGLGQTDEALRTCERAERHLRPSPYLLRLKGDAQRRTSRLADAETSYRASLAASPDNPDVLHNLSRICFLQGDLEEALALQERQLEIAQSVTAHQQHVSRARCETIRLRLAVAKWDGLETLVSDALDQVRSDGTGLDPFLTMLLSEDGGLQLKSARAASLGLPAAKPGVTAVAPRKPGRLRIGYVSADFQDHPLTHLMSRVFELHDRNLFEIVAYSAGQDVKNPYRSRIERAVEHFRDVKDIDDEQLEARIRRDGIDVLVDLAGHTRNNRLGALRNRPAPVSVHVVGFPGTIAHPGIDYFLADPVSLPPALEPQFAERIVRLPGSYLPMDNTQDIPKATSTRAQHGLPATGFVFAALLQTSKLNPDLMDAYAEILRAVHGSVIWLLEDKPRTIERLRAEAEQRGVARERLVCAPRVARRDHLNRLTLADLALDSWPCGGHTTSIDALWAGVPVLTREGSHFASRAPSSLLVSAGLPDMIARDTRHYIELAVRHGRDAAHHQAITERLARGRNTCRLFDTLRYTRELESAFQRMAERAQLGLPPESFLADA